MKQLGQEESIGTTRILLVTGLVAVVFLVWAWLFPTTAPPPPTPPAVPASVPAAAGAPPAAAPIPAPAITPAPAASPIIQGAARETVVLDNGDLRLSFDSQGALLMSAVLPKHRELGAAEPDDLVSPLAAKLGQFPLRVETGEASLDTKANSALFQVTKTEEADGGHSVSFTWSDGAGVAVTKRFSLPKSGYEVGFEASLTKGGMPQSEIPLVWGPGLGRLTKAQAKSTYYQQEFMGAVTAGAFKKVTRSKVSDETPTNTEAVPGPIAWAGVINNYFAALFIPEKPMAAARLTTLALTAPQREGHPVTTAVSVLIPWTGKGKLLIGPKEYDRLKAMGGEFPRILDWGSILGPICAVLLWGLRKLHTFAGNWGVAVILLTLAVKLIFFPVTQRSMVKMKEMGEQMKRVKPQMDRLKAKYKKLAKDMSTRAKMNEEMMELYKREGINPMAQMSGCLPLLLQMPIFFALFTLLPKTFELRGAAFFGWIHDLSVADPYYITPIIMGVTMVISTKMTTTTDMEGATKIMLWLMPVMFTWFCLWAPAGLTLYWLTNNVLTMGQQYLINKTVAKRQEAAKVGKKSTPKGESKPS